MRSRAALDAFPIPAPPEYIVLDNGHYDFFPAKEVVFCLSCISVPL
jgi:hypothetical protein